MPDLNHDKFIQLAQQGDPAAVTALYERHKQPIFRYYYYKLGDKETAEDLTMEVFLRMLKALPRYQQRQASFRAWLFQIARNLLRDHFRRGKHRQHAILDENFAANGEGPEMFAARRLMGDHLQAALRKLTPDQADVVILRFVAEMRIGEVAEALDKSESAVKALQARGLARLHSQLAFQETEYG